MATSASEHLDWFAKEIGVNSPEMAEEKLDAFREKMTNDPGTVREIQVLVSWLGLEVRPMTFTAIAKDLNIQKGEVRLLRDNAIRLIKQHITRE